MATLSADFNGSVKVRNADGLKVNLAAAQARAKIEIKAVVGEWAAVVQQRTIDLCPKKTFYMSEHVRADFSKAGYVATVGWDAKDFIGTADANGRPRSFYPFFVEFGTRHMRAQPSLSIAFKENEAKFKASMDAALRNAYSRGTRQS